MNNNNATCPPPDVRSNINKQLPSGFVEYARRRVEERKREVFERTGAYQGGGCSFFGGGRCVCHGMSCERLWNEWIALDCPPAAAPAPVNANENFGFHENAGNNNSNASSIKSNNSWNTLARKQEKKMQNEARRKTLIKRRRNSRRRASRHNYRK